MSLGSGIRDPKKPIPDPGIKKAPDPGSGTLHYSKEYNNSICKETDSLCTLHEISVSNDMNIFCRPVIKIYQNYLCMSA
jgi:hypothetical protein